MVQAQKKKKRSSVADLINRMLEDADRARGGFSLKAVQAYYDEGLTARQEREPDLVKATPKRVETREATALGIHPKMNIKALGEALGLATQLEEAAQGQKLDLRKWVKG